jgi:hypothetical protein
MIVEFEVFRDHLGVGATDPEVDDVSRLYDAIGAEIVRLTRRAYEGDAGGTYDQVIRIRGVREFTLPFVPVREITAITIEAFDGTTLDELATDEWRLEDAARGAVRIRRTAEYVRVAWTTTGAFGADLPMAYLEWGKSRWQELSSDDRGNLKRYHTGDDEEEYFEGLAGHPSGDVMRAILGNRHATGGGVV